MLKHNGTGYGSLSKSDEHFSSMIQDTAKGSAILIIGQMTSTAISAIGTIIVARLLGSTSFGLIAIATIPVNIARALIFLGYGLIGASYGRSIPFLLSGLFAAFLVYINLGTKVKTVIPTIDDFKNLISYGSPLFVSGLLSGSMNQVLNFIRARVGCA